MIEHGEPPAPDVAGAIWRQNDALWYKESADSDPVNLSQAIIDAQKRTALLALFDEAERNGAQGIAIRGREILGP